VINMVVFDGRDGCKTAEKLSAEFKAASYFIEEDIRVIASHWKDEQEIMASIWGENYSEEAVSKLISQELDSIISNRVRKIFNGQ
tara:strand:- start:190 stop:444 length:255 start_codon:yes stop_codon:yes gene_type:complete